MREGTLFFNTRINKLDIYFDDETTYGGLNCGDEIEVLISDEISQPKWELARIEYSDDLGWYLKGCKASEFDLTVRI
ncbi:MAG: DUF5348 domain-containing protein [Ruminococcus sp.]|nr:DUF5348 domain-containing protein [Ruminococcus sp.]